MDGSRFEEAEDSPGFLLWQLTNLWQQQIRTALAPLDITHVQFVLLASVSWLESHGIAVSQVVLSRHAHTDIMMTSQVVRTLEKKGLLTRTVHPHDTRARVVSLTTTGREIVQQALTVVEAVDAQFFQPLGEQGPALLRMMQTLIRTHSEDPSPPLDEKA